MHAIAYWLGLTNANAVPYAFWSGVGGDLPIIAGLFVFVRHHNCHQHRCWRPGHLGPSGAVLCRRHNNP